jgi:DNA-binding Xre family transcriptional regulator
MGQIVTKAKQVRLNYAAQLGRDVSIKEVADAIGISRSGLRRIEENEVSISHAVLAKLCKFYGVQPGDLLEYKENGEVKGNSLPLPLAA